MTTKTEERTWAEYVKCVAQYVKGVSPVDVLTAALPVGLAVWGVIIFFGLLNAPVSAPHPHDYQAALHNILQLQALAIYEAEHGEKAFFVSHIGCATPDVWQDSRVIENLKRMDEKGVAVKLGMGLTGSSGQVHSTNWPEQFAKRLDEKGLRQGDYVVLDRELPCHSAVAGSMRNPRAYICLPRTDDIYPTEYFITTDPGVCREWKGYLLNEFEIRKQSGSGSHQ